MSTMSAPATEIRLGTNVTRKPRRFYLILSIFMVAMVFVGFWPSYFGQLVYGLSTHPSVIHMHAAIFIGWMALLVTQVTLAAQGRIRAHQKVGTIGIAYGCVVLAMGLVVSIAAPILHVKAGEWDMNRATALLIIPLGDMALFGTFFGAAVMYRRRPKLHKRLMLVATIALLFAAVGRMSYLNTVALWMPVWLSPLFGAMVYDGITRRKVHPVYWMALPILVIAPFRYLLVQSEAWQRIAHALLTAFM